MYIVILSGDIETNPGTGLRSRNKIPKLQCVGKALELTVSVLNVKDVLT